MRGWGECTYKCVYVGVGVSCKCVSMYNICGFMCTYLHNKLPYMYSSPD